eukprot:6069865-Pyramimonas_sp.AAC.1
MEYLKCRAPNGILVSTVDDRRLLTVELKSQAFLAVDSGACTGSTLTRSLVDATQGNFDSRCRLLEESVVAEQAATAAERDVSVQLTAQLAELEGDMVRRADEHR